MSHDCIAGSSVQLIEVNTIEVFFSVMTERTSGGQGRDSGKKSFFGDRVPPIISRSGSGTADEVKNSKTIPTSKLNSEEVISY